VGALASSPRVSVRKWCQIYPAPFKLSTMTLVALMTTMVSATTLVLSSKPPPGASRRQREDCGSWQSLRDSAMSQRRRLALGSLRASKPHTRCTTARAAARFGALWRVVAAAPPRDAFAIDPLCRFFPRGLRAATPRRLGLRAATPPRRPGLHRGLYLVVVAAQFELALYKLFILFITPEPRTRS